MTTVGNINIETTTINTQKKVNEQLNNDSNKAILSFQESNQQTQNSGNVEITTAEDAVDFALDLIKLNSESPKYEQFRKDVSFKYNNMIRVAEATGQNLSQEMIQIRLTNYVKGWSFNQFEQDAAKDLDSANAWEYERPAGSTDAEALKALKENYSKLADGYVEFYDGDGSGSIDLIEMFNQELIEHYKNSGLSEHQAKTKAIETAIKFNNMSFTEIDQSNDSSDEMQLYKLLMTKFGTLDDDSTKTIEGLRTLDKDEVQAYLFTKAQFDNTGSNTITPLESQAIEYDIMTGGTKTPNWLKAARNFLGIQ